MMRPDSILRELVDALHSFLRYLLFGICHIAAGARTKSTLDRQIADALRDVHDRGADLYNAGDEAAGYRVYQGGLIVARGLLGHRAGSAKSHRGWHGSGRT